jgi:hypothetical protein
VVGHLGEVAVRHADDAVRDLAALDLGPVVIGLLERDLVAGRVGDQLVEVLGPEREPAVRRVVAEILGGYAENRGAGEAVWVRDPAPTYSLQSTVYSLRGRFRSTTARVPTWRTRSARVWLRPPAALGVFSFSMANESSLLSHFLPNEPWDLCDLCEWRDCSFEAFC